MRKLSIVAVALVFGLVGCISDDANYNVQLERDMQAIENYLQENPIASVKEFKDDPTGLRIFWQELSESEIEPELGDTIFVNYTGKLLSNAVFDTSIESVARENNIYDSSRPYQPLAFLFGYGQVILGFEFTISKMEEGDKATTIFPSIFGYGTEERPSIPRNSPLIYEMELVRIGKIRTEDPENI
ncbi:FKBP-type peptidyl-prolyl cis-trans isomerase [Arthrospiribacter ruber]|uniref:Peptidyl-prolyl cis-trans isomerase n=1 Tax=Arthrospiribacter ruber TaxID=2487934 RepID=A0A951MEQ4_9BACT|nr:FKBP-type peptidyl-prolyl cis-trans isomerase [Arthrospiribacter ruber]MBW3469347.1 FKBP-type peptidyl-prolyl cis-trans isomerase [Arthrospiribacter ruber]